jgi:hypothetical protein
MSKKKKKLKTKTKEVKKQRRLGRRRGVQKKNLFSSAAHHQRDGHKHLCHHGHAHKQVQHGVAQVAVDGVVDGGRERDAAARGDGEGCERHGLDLKRRRVGVESRVPRNFFFAREAKSNRNETEFLSRLSECEIALIDVQRASSRRAFGFSKK